LIRFKSAVLTVFKALGKTLVNKTAYPVWGMETVNLWDFRQLIVGFSSKTVKNIAIKLGAS
jgi:hypothetical protein